MHRKRHPKHEDRDSGKKPNQRKDGDPPRQPWSKVLTPVRMGMALGVVVLGVALYVGLTGRSSNLPASTSSGNTRNAGTAGTASPEVTQLSMSSLPPAPPGTKSPINDTDPVSGKPITATSPTIAYEGYVVAFCCKDSAGYKGGWDRMTETDKDAFVRRWLK